MWAYALGCSPSPCSEATNYDFDDTLQDENLNARINFRFARNISLFGNVRWDMERFGGINFLKNQVSIGGNVNMSRSYSFGGNFSTGDEIFFLGQMMAWLK